MTEIDNTLALSRAGIDTYRQPVVFMREDCHVCRAEGFAALTRIEVTLGDRSVIATLNVLTNGDWLPDDTAALSEEAWAALKPQPGDRASFTHPEPPDSVSAIRAKVYGETLEQQRFDAIIRDVLDHRLSDLDLAAFITACAGDRLSIAETIALTRSMQAAGETLDWGGALMSCAMKNLMGCIWDRTVYHNVDLQQTIADFLTLRKPDLNIVDAYHPMVRNGPQGKSVEDCVEMRRLLASTDPVLVDAAAAKILGYTTDKVTHIKLAADLKLGSLDLSTADVRSIKLS